LKRKYLLFILILSCFAFLASCGSLARQREKFTVSLNSPNVPIGEIETQFNPFMSIGSIKKSTVKALYYPREDAVCLQYRHELTTYNLFWSYSGRQTFITALEMYNKDYADRNLITQNRKTIRNYGVIEGYLYWQQFSFTVLAQANVNVDIGYQFKESAPKENAPYFSVNQRDAEFKEDAARENNRTSAVITMYFTRAQAAELAALFDQSFLKSLITAPVPGIDAAPINVDRDVY